MNKRVKSFGYALKGIKAVVTKEANMKIHLLIAILVILCGVFFRISVSEWLICLVCFALVITAEMFNTALEQLVDFVSPGKNKAAGRVKDIAAGAVLVSAVFAAIAGFIIFIPKGYDLILRLLQT
ncbi:MAG: undecaprenol kinase [Bacteroidetes bacterium]|nr:undecaprenol kinase [Bacteroidota bacterium]